jgi:hypothetical protein
MPGENRQQVYICVVLTNTYYNPSSPERLGRDINAPSGLSLNKIELPLDILDV